MERGSGRGSENAPCAALRGPGRLRFPTEIAALCLLLPPLTLACPVRECSVLSPRPPSLPPSGPRCALRDLGRAAAAPSPLYQQLPAPASLIGWSNRAPPPQGARRRGRWKRARAGRSSFLGTPVARFGPFALADPASCLGTSFLGRFSDR